MAFGEKLASLRKQANLSQRDLADKLNVPRQTITKWEKSAELPDMEKAKKLSSIFNVSIEEFLDYKIESINLDFETVKETIDRENSKFSKVNQFVLDRFKSAESIEILIREKKLTFWQNIFDIFCTPAPGTIELAELLGTGLVYSFLIKEKGNIYLVLVNKTTMITKRLKKDFEKKIIIDGYKYCKYRNNKIK